MMLKKLIVSIVVSGMLLVVSSASLNAEEVETCVTSYQYGGATQQVCGVSTHEPVETGLADINPAMLASIFFSLAGTALIKAKKLARAEVAL